MPRRHWSSTRPSSIRSRTPNDAVGGSVGKFSEEIIKSLKVTDARRNLRELQEALKDSVAAFNTIENQQGGTFATRFFGKNLGRGASKEMVAEIDKLIQAANEGEIEMVDLADRIDEVAEKFADGDDATRRYAEGLVSTANQIRDNAEAVRRAELVIKVLTGTVEEQEAALRELNGTVKESAASQQTAAEKAEAFNAALTAIKGTIPSVKEELDLLEQSQALEKMLQTAIQTAQSWSDVAAAIGLAGQAQAAIEAKLGQSVAGFAQGDTGVEAAASLLREFEGFRSTPYYDVNAFRTGFGSDTITLADGTIKKVTEGMRVSVADANRDLIRRIETEFAPSVARTAGADRFASFSPQQQAALISIAYNYGSIPDRIAEAVRTGTDQQIAAAIRSLGGDNNGVNRNRRNQEAALFAAGTNVEGEVRAQEKLDEDRARAAEARCGGTREGARVHSRTDREWQLRD
ncbi:tail tape measure protein [Synechococcus virus S-ESS1]|uniref:Lysozyme n=1 Tax=Synechococcus virus S-ESS1 TaxID=1964565 RepID=A0A1V0DX14_9CAUD|nr:endolysin [Synechococcus virus S-ESS1]ARB05705.1 tail tape measure protein [Synechococcus virus S-ESS1]